MSGQCLGNWFVGAASSHAACPAAASGYTNENTYLAGPIPAGGGTVANLLVYTNATVTGSDTGVIDVIDNTSGSTLLSCTVNSTTVNTCTNTGSASVQAGHYLEVKITFTGATPDTKQWRVSFRY